MTALRLGMLTPSSNTVLEPATYALLDGVAGITAHFQRLRVLSITLDGGSTGQFDPAPMVAAAEMLADAKVHAICWNGTSGSWLGLEADQRPDPRLAGNRGPHANPRPQRCDLQLPL